MSAPHACAMGAPAPEPPAFELTRNPHGRWLLTLADGTRHEGVTPVRAFPISAPAEGLALLAGNGHELLWIDSIARLANPARELIVRELEVREFAPLIERIRSVSSFATPSVWDVETDRGPTRLTLKAEEDIRRLAGRTRLLIASGEGVQFRIRDSSALDRHSRRLLERFL